LVARVTSSLFDVLRARPLIGGTFGVSHEVAGNDRVAVISHGLWRRQLGGDPGIVGRTLRVADGTPVVLGVMPEGFSYPVFDDRLADIWTPYVIPRRRRRRTGSGKRWQRPMPIDIRQRRPRPKPADGVQVVALLRREPLPLGRATTGTVSRATCHVPRATV